VGRAVITGEGPLLGEREGRRGVMTVLLGSEDEHCQSTVCGTDQEGPSMEVVQNAQFKAWNARFGLEGVDGVDG